MKTIDSQGGSVRVRHARRPIVLVAAASVLWGCSGTIPDRAGDDDGGGGRDSGAGGSGSAATGGGATSGSGGASSTASGSTSSGTTTSVAASGSGGGSAECMGGMKPSDPNCYWEAVCPEAVIDDVAGQLGDWVTATLTMSDRRWPGMRCVIEAEADDQIWQFADNSSLGALSDSLMTVVHEGTHLYHADFADWSAGTRSMYTRCDYSPQITGLEGFPRSEIAPHVQGTATSLYESYLSGTQGTYGFIDVLDEWNCYVNGMAAIGMYGDHVDSFGVSGTDGAVAFAYYLELYLKVARTEHPDVYAAIQGDASLVNYIRMGWNRMHFFLAIADKYPNLSIEAPGIKQLLYAEENLSELEMLLGIPVAASSCN